MTEQMTNEFTIGPPERYNDVPVVFTNHFDLFSGTLPDNPAGDVQIVFTLVSPAPYAPKDGVSEVQNVTVAKIAMSKVSAVALRDLLNRNLTFELAKDEGDAN